MHDNFNIQLKQKVRSLPVLKHSSNLWDKIQSDLDFDEKLDSRVKELPVYSHDPALWNITQGKIAKREKRLRLYNISGIAASVILAASLIIYTSHNKGYSKNYSVEIINNTEQVPVNGNDAEDINTMLQQFCTYSNINCNSPDFMRIRSELSRLETEIRKLNQVISNYGGSDEIIKCLIRMENQKSELINELLKC